MADTIQTVTDYLAKRVAAKATASLTLSQASVILPTLQKAVAAIPAPPLPAPPPAPPTAATSITLSPPVTISAKEGSGGGITYIVFNVTRTGDTGPGSQADWSVAGSGASPAQATDFEGDKFPGGTVFFGGGETTKQLWVPIKADTVPEVDEAFTITLSNPSGCAIINASAVGVILNDDVATAPAPAPTPAPPAPVPAPPVVAAGSRLLASALPPGLGQMVFDEPFADQSRMAWHPRFNPGAPWKRSCYFGTQLDKSGWEDAGCRQGGNDLQIYTDAYYPSQYDPSGSGVVNAPGTMLGVETVKIVNGRARMSLLANPQLTNPQLFQYFGGHPTPSGKPVKRCGAIMTTEKSFSQPYGYFLARVNVDALTPGSWPALWLLPTPETMPLSTEWKELDAYEGMLTRRTEMNINYHGGVGVSMWPAILTPGPHDIGIMVTRTEIWTTLDGVEVPGSRVANKYPVGVNWYILLDLAVGGWNGQEAMEAPVLPSYMDIIYCKAFALSA